MIRLIQRVLREIDKVNLRSSQEAAQMCGIFGFMFRRPVDIAKVFKLFEKLEVHKYASEPRPVGGYGAGLAILKADGEVMLRKVGSIDDSPARHLSRIVKVGEASVLVGHVRMPSAQFMNTARFEETAQPYVAKCHPSLTVVSAHNGNVTNYKEIREKLGKAHFFESEKVELIDSEVIPHFFEELLKEKNDVAEALDALFTYLEGPSAISLLQIEKERVFLHFIHKGQTRGLNIWTNEKNEVVFCSRNEPLMEEVGHMLVQGRFSEKVAIRYHEDVSLRLSFPLAFK